MGAPMHSQFHRRWLKFTAIGVASFGPVFSLGTMDATLEPARFTLDLLSWPLDGATSYSHPDTRFLTALTGGFLLGWGVMIWWLATQVYDVAPEPVRRSVMAGLLAWFVLDSLGSVASGNAANVPFNVIVLMALAGPLWRPARAAPAPAPHAAAPPSGPAN